MRRLFFAELLAPDRAVVRGAEARHLAVVLRAQPGEEFELAAQGRRYLAAVRVADAESVEFGALRPLEAAAGARSVTLLAAVFRFERFEWLLEKATELGVTEVQPVLATRTAAHLARAAMARHPRWERLALNAAQQARRTAPPRILAPLAWRQALDTTRSKSDCAVLLSERPGWPALAEVARAQGGAGAAVLAVGPEGGWSDEEHRAAEQHGFAPASLGRLILRAETAAIAALAIWNAVADLAVADLGDSAAETGGAR